MGIKAGGCCRYSRQVPTISHFFTGIAHRKAVHVHTQTSDYAHPHSDRHHVYVKLLLYSNFRLNRCNLGRQIIAARF